MDKDQIQGAIKTTVEQQLEQEEIRQQKVQYLQSKCPMIKEEIHRKTLSFVFEVKNPQFNLYYPEQSSQLIMTT